jgi:hypothetical protein
VQDPAKRFCVSTKSHIRTRIINFDVAQCEYVLKSDVMSLACQPRSDGPNQVPSMTKPVTVKSVLLLPVQPSRRCGRQFVFQNDFSCFIQDAVRAGAISKDLTNGSAALG